MDTMDFRTNESTLSSNVVGCMQATSTKYVQKHFWKKYLCALQVFLCVLVSRPMCVHAA